MVGQFIWVNFVEQEEFDSPDEDDFYTEEEHDEAMDRYWEEQVEKKTDLQQIAIDYLTDEYSSEEN